MSPVTEFDLPGARNTDSVVLLQLFLKNVHHADGVGEGDDHVEARGVHRD